LPPIPSPDPKIEWHARIEDVRHVQLTAHSHNYTGTSELESTAFPNKATSAVEQSLTGLGNYITEPEQSIYSFCFETPKQRPTGRFLKIARAAHMRTRLIFVLSVGNASQTPPTSRAPFLFNFAWGFFDDPRGRRHPGRGPPGGSSEPAQCTRPTLSIVKAHGYA
jgi:hypothetical protein